MARVKVVQEASAAYRLADDRHVVEMRIPSEGEWTLSPPCARELGGRLIEASQFAAALIARNPAMKPPAYELHSLERARAHLRAWVSSHAADDRPGMPRYVAEVEAVLDRLDELEAVPTPPPNPL